MNIEKIEYHNKNNYYGLSEMQNLTKKRLSDFNYNNKSNNLSTSQQTKIEAESKFSKLNKNEETNLSQNVLTNDIKNIYCEEGAEYFLSSKEIAMKSIHLDDEIIDESKNKKKIQSPKTIEKVDCHKRKKKLSLFKGKISKSDKKKLSKNSKIKNKFLFNENKMNLMMKNKQIQEISPVPDHIINPTSQKPSFDVFTTYCKQYRTSLKDEKSIDQDIYKKLKKATISRKSKVIDKRQSSTKTQLMDLIADLNCV